MSPGNGLLVGALNRLDAGAVLNGRLTTSPKAPVASWRTMNMTVCLKRGSPKLGRATSNFPCSVSNCNVVAGGVEVGSVEGREAVSKAEAVADAVTARAQTSMRAIANVAVHKLAFRFAIILLRQSKYIKYSPKHQCGDGNHDGEVLLGVRAASKYGATLTVTIACLFLRGAGVTALFSGAGIAAFFSGAGVATMFGGARIAALFSTAGIAALFG